MKLFPFVKDIIIFFILCLQSILSEAKYLMSFVKSYGSAVYVRFLISALIYKKCVNPLTFAWITAFSKAFELSLNIGIGWPDDVLESSIATPSSTGSNCSDNIKNIKRINSDL